VGLVQTGGPAPLGSVIRTLSRITDLRLTLRSAMGRVKVAFSPFRRCYHNVTYRIFATLSQVDWYLGLPVAMGSTSIAPSRTSLGRPRRRSTSISDSGLASAAVLAWAGAPPGRAVRAGSACRRLQMTAPVQGGGEPCHSAAVEVRCIA
jgi:hypothetical protein